MARDNYFTLRVNQTERRMLENLADRLQRTQSDAVRLLIREAAQGLAAEPNAKTAELQTAAEGVQQ